jgi:hypothetical protein
MDKIPMHKIEETEEEEFIYHNKKYITMCVKLSC